MKISETIRILLVKRGNLPVAELARRLGMTPQNLSRKLQREHFTPNDLEKVASVLDCKVKISFLFNDTGEELAEYSK